ncbi:MAG: LamG-like jellyroll fold domain-containing protein [Candidatus Paceibacterota bacterium]
MSKKQIAFTLIELLVVIAIIGILSGLIVITMNGVTAKANVAKAQVFSNSLRNALMLNFLSEWKFDETAGISVADSWGSNAGTLTNFTFDSTDGWRSGSQCVYGGCLQFDGANDIASFGNLSSSLGQSFTFEIWAYRLGSTDSYGLIAGIDASSWSTTGGFLLFDSNSSIYARLRNHLQSTEINSTLIPVVNDVWRHYVAVWNKPNLDIYLNGSKVGSSSVWNYDVGWNNRTMTMGSWGGSTQGFYGILDTVRVYGVAMPISGIQENYYSGLNLLFTKKEITKEEYLSRLNSVAKQ